MARLRKLKDETKSAFLYFTDGSKVACANRVHSSVSNRVYFETDHNDCPHGETYMRIARGGKVFLAWSVNASLVSGVSDK